MLIKTKFLLAKGQVLYIQLHYYMTNFETYYPFTDGASTEAKFIDQLDLHEFLLNVHNLLTMEDKVFRF